VPRDGAAACVREPCFARFADTRVIQNRRGRHATSRFHRARESGEYRLETESLTRTQTLAHSRPKCARNSNCLEFQAPKTKARCSRIKTRLTVAASEKSSAIFRRIHSKANRNLAPRVTRVLRIAVEINRLEPIFDSHRAPPSHFTNKFGGNDENIVAIRAMIFRGTRIASPYIALRSPPRTTARACPQARPGYRRRSPNVRQKR
jgi:hypothetical protein